MAWGRILANAIVMGGSVFMRAASQAYRQAIINGQKAGVAAEGAAKNLKSTITEDEARLILGVDSTTPHEDILKKFKHLYEINQTHGTFYLQSKVYRAMEAIDPNVAEMVNSGSSASEKGSKSQQSASQSSSQDDK